MGEGVFTRPRQPSVNEPGKASEQRLRAAIDSAPSGLLMIDAEGRIVLVNREVERLFGYPREELLGRPVELIVPERFHGAHPEYRGKFTERPSVRQMAASSSGAARTAPRSRSRSASPRS